MWSVRSTAGVWDSPRLQARVDLMEPTVGLHDLRFGGAPLHRTQVMQVTLPTRNAQDALQVEDVYVRGPDLIVTYAEAASSRVRPQIYWRIIDEPTDSPALVIELLVSMQTQWLDSNPRIQLMATIPSIQWHSLAGSETGNEFQSMRLHPESKQTVALSPPVALLARVPHAPCSYGQSILATDLLSAQLVWDPASAQSRLETTHFGERLEKGVLRRLCSRAILAPRENDETLVAGLLRHAATAEPPLAT